MLTSFATIMATAGIALACLAAYVAYRRDARMGWSLAVLLLAGAWWGVAYAVELGVDDIGLKSRWGDLKYLGIIALAPAWLTFVLQYVGRERWVTSRLLVVLAVVPVVTILLLAVPATHDLLRFYPPSAAGDELPEVEAGPLFDAFFGYNYLLLVAATGLFVARIGRLARSYRRMAVVLVAAAVVPLAVNALYNLNVGWFASVDLTPFAFTLTGAVLVWGLFHERLVDLTPLARGAVLEKMSDAVYVTDPFGRIVDLNPAAVQLAGASRTALLGRQLGDVVAAEASDAGATELTLEGADGVARRRTFDIAREQLADVAGRPAGVVVVLHEITQRVQDRQRLERVLEDQSRVASALQASMVPPTLPEIAGIELASEYLPAGDGGEVGGDFLDVFDLGQQTWAFVLGDVSGKGAEAATVSAATRYTLRALAAAGSLPSDTVRKVNTSLLSHTDVERHCTLVYGQLRPERDGTTVVFTLAGHHPPIVRRTTGEVEEVGTLGTALALFDEPELHDTTVHLAPGDLLCVFTDGLVEARRGREMFGGERVAALLNRSVDRPAVELSALLVDAVHDFHGDQLDDDLAVLVVKNAARQHPSPRAMASARCGPEVLAAQQCAST
ncbi:MAG TPA: histidine kinase N-terminal 7TM domain-containing protein [Nocardioides sp.]|nr:histidine kinase N-terminal 7TM domain-containing protein [Nocardioides sp.]